MRIASVFVRLCSCPHSPLRRRMSLATDDAPVAANVCVKRKQPEPPQETAAYFGPLVEKRGYNGNMEQKMEGLLSRTHTFQQWLAANLPSKPPLPPVESSQEAPPLSPPTSAVRIIREVIAELEVTHSLHDFHFKIHNPFDFEKRRPLPGCALTVFAGREGEEGPIAAASCMSCDLTCSLAVGVGVSSSVCVTSSDSLLSETAHTRVWIDAKARPMLVFTPLRHVERLSELHDCELHDLLQSIHTVLTTRGLNVFQCCIANHGSFRNHAHLHIKLRFPPNLFEKATKKWSQGERQKLERIREFAASCAEGREKEKAQRLKEGELGPGEQAAALTDGPSV